MTTEKESAAPAAANDYSVSKRWTPLLARRFCAVSSAFLEHYHDLRPHPGARGLTSTEAMLVIQLFDFKWDERAPFPTVRKLATRLGITPRAVRSALKSLEDGNYIKRVPMPDGGPNRYHFDGLFTSLERLLQEKAKEAA